VPPSRLFGGGIQQKGKLFSNAIPTVRLAARRGKKRALVAVGHSILTIVYHVMKYKIPYKELGEDFFDKLNGDRLCRHYTKRLESLGYRVELSKGETAA
jgi:hypothetical protein